MVRIKDTLVEQMHSYSTQVCVLLLVYLWGWLDFSFLWVVICLIGHQVNVQRRQKREKERKIAKRIVEEGKRQKV